MCGAANPMKNIFLIRTFWILLALFTLVGCTDESQFTRHVFPYASEVQQLKYSKASCMHCPMYFSFTAPDSVTAKIIERHKLRLVETAPDQMIQVVSLLREKWWADQNTLQSAKKYWIEYRDETGSASYERPFRLALIKGNTVYFATSGFFREGYKPWNQ